MEHWYLLAEDRFREALVRASTGEDIDLLLVQLWSESHPCTENHGEDCDGCDLEGGIATFSLPVEAI
ncbi:MAG TPA: hypothetical protein VM938_10585 [Acidimicrobiales bacterium]|nr:hypothetical protein [Acidimicrobiales bacterium]